MLYWKAENNHPTLEGHTGVKLAQFYSHISRASFHKFNR